MKKDVISKAFDYIDDSYIREAAMLSPDRKGGEENEQVKKIIYTRKIIKVAIIAAVLMSLMIVSAVAADILVYSPQKAVEVAQQELERMQEIGLLSEELFIKDDPNRILEFQEGLVIEPDGETRKFAGKVYSHHYSVRSWADQCSVNFDVDVKDGIVRSFHIEAMGDESDNRVDDREVELNGKVYYYYDNYNDIFHPDMTINEFCAKLSEYWGFGDFTLEKMTDQIYDEECALPTGDEALSSLCCKNYLYISFEDDKRGEQMCISLMHFPGRISLHVHRDHPKG